MPHKITSPSMTRRALSSGLIGASSIALILGAKDAEAAPQKKSGKYKPLYKDAKAPLETRISDLMAQMTLEEKIGQMMCIWFYKAKIQKPNGDFDPVLASKLYPDGIGMLARPSDRQGVTQNTGAGDAGATPNRNARDTAIYVNQAQKWAIENTRLGIPLMMHEEALHGFVARDATCFPQAIGLASSFDPELITRIFSVAAREMRARGSFMALAPVVDAGRDPRWGRIEETYGEDPYVCGTMGIAAVRGFQGDSLPLAKDKVLATLKHMTGHGQPENGTNTAPAQVSERVLREEFFTPFERIVKQTKLGAVMPSYNEIDGLPSHANAWLLRQILRKEWGFEGVTVSDYFAVKELISRHKLVHNMAEAAEVSVKAGVDIETADPEAFPELVSLVKAGKLDIKLINEAVYRVLRLKFVSGQFDNPYVDEKTAEAKTATKDAVALAREAAVKSAVLLKNNGVLPLDGKKVGKVLLLGTHAKDTPIGGYSDVPKHVVSMLEGLSLEAKNQGFTLDYREGIRITEQRIWGQDPINFTPKEVTDRLMAEALQAAKSADTIIMVLGDNEQLSREAWADNHLGDRQTLDLMGRQNELAEAIFALKKPTIIFLLNGRPLSINLLQEKADAIIEGWYLGQETGFAAADLLFGRANPGGKLPVSVARNVGQLPIFYNHKPTARRGYLDGTTTPLYPFGFGLSYTSFDLSAPRLSADKIGLKGKTTVSVDVTNTGKYDGDEVVQLYIRDDVSSVTRPVKELKAFKRISLKAGQKTTVSFEIGENDLWFYGVDMTRKVEAGTFSIMTGPNSVDVKSVTLTVA